MWLSGRGNGRLDLHLPVLRSSRCTVALLTPAELNPPTTYAVLPTLAADTSTRAVGADDSVIQPFRGAAAA
jgi:hypothetical protein